MENGYETISYGKIYHYPNDTGEYWSDNDGGAHQADYQDPKAQERKRNGESGEHGRKGPAFEYPEVDDYAYNDGKVTQRALDKMKALKAEDKPFFMAVGYVSPHLPFIQPKKYWDLYDHNEVPLADNAYQPENSPYIAMHAQHDNAELRNMYLDIPSKGLLSDEMSRNLVHGYYASVSYMDALIGDLIDGLDAMGLRDNTTIILWSDHGFFLGEHGFWCKHSTFYEAIKIPFIISSPGFAKNQTTDSFTELVDVYPTLCELTGITPPGYIHGESLTTVMENPSVNLKDEIYTRYKQGEAVVDKNYSYTEFFQGEQYLGNMLYDLNVDLKQNTDISKRAENAALVNKYSKKLKVMRDFVNKDPLKEK
jgi:arylsulfatase A-like enzyme